VNFIKIDRSFVTGITLQSNEYEMIKMLCKLAHKIGVKVVAEGVETVEELDLLYRADVDLLQGYLFSKPISLEEMLASPPKPFPQILMNTLQHKKVPTLADICIKEMNVVAFDDRLITLKKNFDAQLQDYCIILDNKKCVGVLYRTDYYAAISPYIGTKGEQKRDVLTLHKRVHQIMRKDFLTLHIDSEMILAKQFFTKEPSSIIVITNRNQTCLGTTNVQALLAYQNTECSKIN
jgi:sensor c-di-GMP phosphodiesterase-like protein